MWNYAKLSKMAKAVGGPEKLIQIIVDSGVKKGRLQMLALLPIAVFAGFAIYPLFQYFKQKRKISHAALESAKQELIQGINSYDAAQMNGAADHE